MGLGVSIKMGRVRRMSDRFIEIMSVGGLMIISFVALIILILLKGTLI